MALGIFEWLIDDILNLKNFLQPSVVDFIRDSLEMTTILLFLIINSILIIWYERKVMARMWNTRGPVFIDFNYGHFFGRTWKFGLLQLLADFVKIFSKEEIIPEKADKFPFNIGYFAFIVAPPFIIVGILPLGGRVIADPAVGFLLVFAIFSLIPVGVLVTGWSSNNKYSLLGAFRSAAQMISYEIPLILSVGSVVLLTGSFSLLMISNQQKIIPFALIMPIGFIVFLTALAAETERIPFDIPEAEAELVMGWRTELAGYRFMMAMATEYFLLLIGSFVGIFLFLGGPYIPFVEGIEFFEGIPFLENLKGINNEISQNFLLATVIFTIKLWLFVFLYVWIRSALPRVRIDQLLDIGWKRLIPLAILNIIISVFLEILPQKLDVILVVAFNIIALIIVLLLLKGLEKRPKLYGVAQ
jgi:NADH-quinone oxidoreductase subunit H